jgi:Uncharacterized protein conserved in bacteria
LRLQVATNIGVRGLKSTKFWIVGTTIILIAAAIASFAVMNGHLQGKAVANIYQNRKCIYSIELSKVAESYTIQIGGKVSNTVIVENGRICIVDATCPDHICIHQGWISNGMVPIVCLPNNLVIQIDGSKEADIDTLAR